MQPAGLADAAPQRGANLRHELEIPLQTAVTGGKIEFYLSRGGREHEKLAVTIPPGVETGSKIRLREQGHQSGSGGPPGDLILLIKVSDHPFFRRVGKNLELRLPVTIAEAVLGAKVDIPTPAGTVALTIPPASSSGRRLRLKGQGVQQTQGNAGDLNRRVADRIAQADRRIVASADRAIRSSQSVGGPSRSLVLTACLSPMPNAFAKHQRVLSSRGFERIIPWWIVCRRRNASALRGGRREC